MVHCNALHCKNNSRKFGVDVIRYFSYPRNAELRQKWAAKTRPDGKQVPYYASICQRHFKPSQLYYTKFGALKFKPGEVPTLFKPKVCKEDEPAEFEEYADPQQEYYFAKSARHKTNVHYENFMSIKMDKRVARNLLCVKMG